jgi:hypothetical protein
MSAFSRSTADSLCAPISAPELDRLLTVQLAVAWAGEAGEEPRLGWWRSDLCSEFGGEDLFRRLLLHTWRWATLQGAREAARRLDAQVRQKDHNPDRLLTLFSVGVEIDERLDERLRDLKAAGKAPLDALPGLKQAIAGAWQPELFGEWIRSHGEAESVPSPVGRRLKGEPPADLGLLGRRLVAALWPLAGAYPMPHYRRGE